MKMLEICSGSGVMSETFKKSGWETTTIDNNPTLNPDIVMDANHISIALLEEINPDVIWFSPPCTTYSIAGIGHYREKRGSTLFPKSRAAFESDLMIDRLILLVKSYIENRKTPTIFFIENPRGGLRKMLFINIHKWLSRYTVTYCQYGDFRMKPTDIWSNISGIAFKPMCHNGDSCHERAPRGSKTGTQGLKNAYERGKIPVKLCEFIEETCTGVLQ